MDLLQNTLYFGLCMRRECRERFPRQRALAIPKSSRHVRDARAVMHAEIVN